ncbi:MAG: nucleotidyltransferase family protein [Gemmatimonadota bacterium]
MSARGGPAEDLAGGMRAAARAAGPVAGTMRAGRCGASPVAGAVVLAGGRGTRMAGGAAGAGAGAGAGAAAGAGAELSAAQRAAAATGLKGLVPVAGRPFLEHVLEALAAAGVGEVCVVLGPHGGPLRDHLQRWSSAPLSIAYALQPAPRGSADALLAAETWAAGRPCLVVNADNLYPPAAVRPLLETTGHALAGFEPAALVAGGNIPPERVAAFALVRADADGRLVEIVEKPDAVARARLGEGARVSMTCWRFEPSIFDACRAVRPSPRGELELPDAVRLLVARGEVVRVLPVAEPVLDLTGPEDIAAVERWLGGGARG